MKKILLLISVTTSFVLNAQFWSPTATGFSSPSRSLNSISIVDTNVIWANAFDNSDPNRQDFTVKNFTRSIDGGNTWTPGTIDLGAGIATPADLGVSSITAVSSSTAWISVYPDALVTSEVGGIWKTTDSGVSWSKQTTALFNGAGSYANFVHFWDANNGIAQGDPENGEFEIYTTTNGGVNWTRVPAANIPDPNPDVNGEFGYFNLFTVSGNTIWFGTDRGRIFRSSDKGLTWTAYNSVYSSDFGLDRFTFSSATKGILMIHNTLKIYSTADGGATWNPITTPDFYKTEIAYIPGTSTVIAGAEANPFGSSYSTNDGLTWNTIDALYHGTAVFLNTSFGFSAGMNTSSTVGGVYKFTGIPPLKNPSFDLKNQISAYPNPTNGIVYLMSENALIKEATIIDLLGRHVFSSKFLPSNKVDLDIKSLQSGSYVLKVTSDSGSTETMKIMKN